MRISDWSSDVCSSDLRDEGRPALPVRIGLHSGPVVVGNIGSPSRINYTIVGDAVNTAARIEALGSRMQRDDEDCLVLAGAATRTRRSEEHTSELQSLMRISYAVFCLKKKKTNT